MRSTRFVDVFFSSVNPAKFLMVSLPAHWRKGSRLEAPNNQEGTQQERCSVLRFVALSHVQPCACVAGEANERTARRYCLLLLLLLIDIQARTSVTPPLLRIRRKCYQVYRKPFAGSHPVVSGILRPNEALTRLKRPVSQNI